MDFRTLLVPVGPSVIDEFMSKNRVAFSSAYNKIKNKVVEEIADLDVYSVYGRDQRAGGNIFKENRKIRNKFNSYHLKCGNPNGSLWETPDIVGFTIVVAYPSEISKVCLRIDAMVERGVLKTKNASAHSEVEIGSEVPIVSVYGRPILSRGYFACHYNLYEEGVDDTKSYICEVQIKTVLHDAWGAKTHDLTYKTSGQVDRTLVRSFELLGDSLAKLDQQSDLVRALIQKQLQARETKRSALLRTQLERHFHGAISASKSLLSERDALLRIRTNSSKKEVERLKALCLSEFKKGDKRSGAQCLFFLGRMSREDNLIDIALEAYFDLENSQGSDFEKARIIAVSGLMNFFSGDSERAIDETRRALDVLAQINETDIEVGRLGLVRRLKHSMLSSIGYYYADTIGSDNGSKLDAQANAKKFLELSLSARRRIKNCPSIAPIDRKSMQRALQYPAMAEVNYSTIDNELFIRIQLSASEAELKSLRSQLALLNENPPPSMTKEAGMLYDFHDYCARARLMDLERS